MEHRPESLKRGPSVEDGLGGRQEAGGQPSPKREKLQQDGGRVGGSRERATDSPEVAQVRLASVSSGTGSVARAGSGAGGGSLKQQTMLRKHILLADPSLSGQEALIDKVAAVMRDTWSWGELKKFFLRKAEMKENVEATVDLIRDDMDEDDEDDVSMVEAVPAPEVHDVAEAAPEDGEVIEEAHRRADAAPAQEAVDVDEIVVVPPAPAPEAGPSGRKRASTRPSTPPAAPTVTMPALEPLTVVQEQQQPPDDATEAKKKSIKHLSSKETKRLAREKALAEGRAWIEPSKKKAMSALRTETDQQLQRGEFRAHELKDEEGRAILPLEAVRHLRNKERCSCLVVVLSAEHRPAKGDAMVQMKLQDQTNTITFNAFSKRRDLLPLPPPGSILFLRGIYLDMYLGNPLIVGSARDGFDWCYLNLRLTEIVCPSRLEAEFGSLEKLNVSMHAHAEKLSVWAKHSLGIVEDGTHGAGASATTAPLSVGVKKTRRMMRVEELRDETEFFDLVAQIVKVGPLGNERDVFVTDFTSNPRLFKYDTPLPPLAEAQKPSQPFGRYTLKITLFNELASYENSSLAVGKIVKFRNAKVRSRDHLEASLWGDRNSGCRVERLGQADQGVPELVARRAAFAQALVPGSPTAEPEAGPSTLRRSKTAAPWEDPDMPIVSVREFEGGSTFSAFGQIVTATPAFKAENGFVYRSFRFTDFTSNASITDAPNGDPGSPSSPPNKPFGRYVIRLLLSGPLANHEEGNDIKSGDYVFFHGIRVNDKGGRGLEAYFNSASGDVFPFTKVPSVCSALGPLLKQKANFYARIGSPVPEAAEQVACASPIMHNDEDEDEHSAGGEGDGLMDLESIFAAPAGKSRLPTTRFSLMQDAAINTAMDGIFQVVKVHSYANPPFITVTDWTQHPLIRPAHPPLPDPNVVNVEEPFGKYVLEVLIVSPALQQDRQFIDALAPGAIVLLHGLLLVRSYATMTVRGHLLETHNARWTRLREDDSDSRVLDLQIRRSQTYQLSATQLEPADAAPPLSNSASPPAANVETELKPEHAADDSISVVEEQESTDELSPTLSLMATGRGTMKLRDVGSYPAKYTVCARVVDVLPKNLEDAVVCVCRTCDVILPTTDKVCRNCMSQHDGSLGQNVEWTYRVMLRLDDGTDTVWAALYQRDLTALFPALPPASDYCDSATQIIDTLASQLAVLHPTIGAESATGRTAPLAPGPVLELGLVSFYVHGVRGVGEHGAVGYRIARTVLRG